MVLAAAAAAFMTGVLLWRILLWRRANGRRARGWVTGMWVGILSHPVALFLTLAFFDIGDQFQMPNRGQVLSAFFGGAVYSYGSLLALGWLTVPVGICLGAVMAPLDNE